MVSYDLSLRTHQGGTEREAPVCGLTSKEAVSEIWSKQEPHLQYL